MSHDAEPDFEAVLALVVEGGNSLTYGAWRGRSNSVARGLLARGVEPGDRVGLLFDPPGWADFAVAHEGILAAGAVAVLLSPGAAAADVARALSHSGAVGLLCAPRLAPREVQIWAAHPDEVGADHDDSPVAPPAMAPGTIAEIVYPPAPLARPRPVAVPRQDDRAEDAATAFAGWLVHAWAPGSLAGQYALRLVDARGARAAVLAAFAPDALFALIEARRAVACGLTPALAATMVASGASRHHDVSSVSRVVLSGSPSPLLLAGLASVFPDAEVVGIDAGHPPAPATTAAEDGPPVAVSQVGMLWHEQLTPGSFNLPCLARRYEGRLDVAALEGALSELVRRHQPLRTTFEVLKGQPRQVIADHQDLKLEIVDLSGLAPDERDAEAAALLADATSRPFDLAGGPLFEPRLVRLGPHDHVLVVRLHHCVFDDWSVDVFRRELSALYAAALAGEPSPLVEPATSFADFCRRQKARLAGQAGAAQLAWWRSELAGAPLAVQLPIGGDLGTTAGSRPEPGEPLRLDLPPALVAELRALAPRLRATPFMTVLAAFSVLLGRTIAQEDLVIATVVAHRDQSDLEPLVGCFTKKVPLRLRLDGDPSFSDLVARTRTSLLGALSHQGVSFDAAVSHALGRAAADHGVVPQVGVVFQGETPQQVKLSLPGLTTSRYETGGRDRRERHFSSGPETPGVREDAPVWGDGIYLGTFLILSLLDSADGMALVARGVFHRPTTKRLLEDFRSLLTEAAAGPTSPISQLGAEPSSSATNRRSTCIPAEDVLELRGFRARRSRLEAALARCPGVAEVAVAVAVPRAGDTPGENRLVAYVVADGEHRPTLAQLRHAAWATLPGTLWPAEAVIVDSLSHLSSAAGTPARPEADPTAALLGAMWGEMAGRSTDPDQSYWQDFSFLQLLSEARQAGLAISDQDVARSRTLQTLAAAMAAGPSRPGS